MTVAAKNLRTFFANRLRTRRGRKLAAGVAVAVLTAGSLAGCTTGQLQGQSPAYLIINSLECANGSKPQEMSNTCSSDVVTLVKTQVGGQQVLVPTIYEDPGRVSFRLGLKNPGSSENPTQPTSANYITIDRYRVNYVRADGRNTPGVDVPYPFDSAITATVNSIDTATISGLTLVRIQAKQENPLKPLAYSGGAIAISALAEVTFYGHDQAGREVSTMGRIGVTFSDWGDPD